MVAQSCTLGDPDMLPSDNFRQIRAVRQTGLSDNAECLLTSERGEFDRATPVTAFRGRLSKDPVELNRHPGAGTLWVLNCGGVRYSNGNGMQAPVVRTLAPNVVDPSGRTCVSIGSGVSLTCRFWVLELIGSFA
jgi:hypothetical protein